MVVELSMQYCRKKKLELSETYETFLRLLTTEFERKVDVQNHELGWIRFRNRLLRFLQYYILSLTNIYCRSVPLSVNSFLDFWTSLNPSKRTVVVIYSDLMKSTGFKTVHSSYWEKYYPVYFPVFCKSSGILFLIIVLGHHEKYCPRSY